MKPIPTINVIKYASRDSVTVMAMMSFPDTADGTKDAEGLFERLVQNDTPGAIGAEELNDIISDGYFDTRAGEVITLVHSCGFEE